MLKTSRQLDIVTIAYDEEIKMLQMQARSIALHVPAQLISSIIIIANDLQFRKFRKKFNKYILPDYGPLQKMVQLIDGNTMIPIASREKGWVKQQILKLLATQYVRSDYYLIMDAKNHFIRPVETTDLWDEDGKMYTPWSSLNMAFSQEFKNACTLFGVTAKPEFFQRAMSQSTPYLMSKDLIEQMIREIECKSAKSFALAFLKDGPYTEFYLLYAYLLSKPGLFKTWYTYKKNINVTFWNPRTETHESLEERSWRVSQPQVRTLGVHRRYVKNMPDLSRQTILNIWLEAGLLKSADEANYFMSLPKSPWQQTKAWLKALF